MRMSDVAAMNAVDSDRELLIEFARALARSGVGSDVEILHVARVDHDFAQDSSGAEVRFVISWHALGKYASKELHDAIQARLIDRSTRRTFQSTDSGSVILRRLREEAIEIDENQAEVNAAISALEKRIEGPAGRIDEADVESGPYSRMGLKSAIIRVLEEARAPLPNHVIRERLEQGGWHTVSRNPGGLVNRALQELRARQAIVQVERGVHAVTT